MESNLAGVASAPARSGVISDGVISDGVNAEPEKVPRCSLKLEKRFALPVKRPEKGLSGGDHAVFSADIMSNTGDGSSEW